MGRRRDGERVDPGIEPHGRSVLGQGGKLWQHVRAEPGGVEVHPAGLPNAPVDGPGEHVPRRQFRIPVLGRHEPFSPLVDQQRPLTSEGFGEQRGWIDVSRKRGGMKLDELQIEHAGPGARGHGQPGAVSTGRIGCSSVQPADATGGQNHRRCQHQCQ